MDIYESSQLFWIHQNLGPIIKQALTAKSVMYTEDWLAAIAMRETGELIGKEIARGYDFPTICSLMKGDYSRRPGDAENCYHGYSFWQIDIASYPDFIKSGNWKDPVKSCLKAIDVLEGKRLYLKAHAPLVAGDTLERAITAAYNNGEGNEMKDIINHQDIDARTTGHNYSAEVWRFRAAYKLL